LANCKEYDVTQSAKEANPQEYWSAIIHDHSFRDKIQVEAFERNIIDHVMETSRKTDLKIMRLNSVLEIYTLTPEISPLRSLAVAIYECIPPNLFKTPGVVKFLGEVPKFAAELVKNLLQMDGLKKVLRSLKAEDFYGRESKGDNGAVAKTDTS
jgi:hypothetical protein